MTSLVAPFDLHRLIVETEAFFRQPARDRGLTLKVEQDPVPPYVLGDKLHLRQVLINLIGNAIKFTGTGGVTLRVSRAEGKVDTRFSVQDTGMGIAPEEQDRLFKPFSQTLTGLMSEQGSGLGLALSSQYVRIMGGELSLESTPGTGSCFSFRLRLPPTGADVSSQAQGQDSIVGLEPGQPVRRVLIVDDLADNRAPLRALLKGWDPQSNLLELREGADGQEAVAIWREWQPQILFMDMRMPVLSGEEATRRIRALEAVDPDAVRTLIVALTASAFQEDRERFLACGCDDYASKPFKAEELVAILEYRAGLKFLRSGTPSATLNPLSPLEAAARLLAQPEEWSTALRAAVDLGDFARITRLVEQIGDQDPALSTLLSQWAYDYDWEAFTQALQGGMNA